MFNSTVDKLEKGRMKDMRRKNKAKIRKQVKKSKGEAR